MEKFENKLKNKLLNKNMELDTDELWGEVYPHIKKKKRRFVVFYFLGFLLLASVATLLYKMQGGKSASIAEYSSKAQSDMALSQNQIETIKASDKNIQVSFTNEGEQESNYNKKIISNELTGLNNQGEIAIQKSTPIEKQKSGREPKPSQPNFKETIDLGSIKTTNKEEQLNIATTLQLPLSTEKDNIIEEYESLKFKTLLNQIDALKLVDRNLSKTPKHDFQTNLRNQSSNFSIMGALGGSMVNKQLATKDGMSSEHLQRRLSNEKSLESIDASLGINYALKENFEISLGLNFRRINEKISDTYTRTDTVLLENVIIENIISSRGTEAIYGDVLASRSIETNLEAYNRYNELSAFVDFRYFMGVHRWKPYASLGYQHSVYSNQSGYWLWEEQLYDISEDNEGFISSSFSPAIRFGLGLDFDFSEKASIRFEGRFLKYLNSISTDSYPLTQKYMLMGLQTGLNIKL